MIPNSTLYHIFPTQHFTIPKMTPYSHQTRDTLTATIKPHALPETLPLLCLVGDIRLHNGLKLSGRARFGIMST